MNPQRTYDYLVKARTQIFDLVRPLTVAQYTQEHPIGLRSLACTLHHVRGAERSYLERVRGRTTPLDGPAPADNPDVTPATALDFATLERLWTYQATDAREVIARVDDWHTPRVFTTTWDGRPYAYRASTADILAQLAFHEVHHRCQAMHMLHRLGIPAGDLDFNTLMWEPVEAR